MEERRESILRAERILLHTLGFDFNVEHPYKHLLNVVKRINQTQNMKESNSRNLAQVAWNFANDRFAVFHTLMLLYSMSPNLLFLLFSVYEPRYACSLLHKTLRTRFYIWVWPPMQQKTSVFVCFFVFTHLQLFIVYLHLATLTASCVPLRGFKTFAFNARFARKLVGRVRNEAERLR